MKPLELSRNLFTSVDRIIEKWRFLHQQLKNTQLEEYDVLHFMELHDLSASEGYRAYKLTQEILRKRREFKNELNELAPIVNFINNNLSDSRKGEKRTKLLEKVEEITHINENSAELKEYRVRILKEIFGETMKQNKRKNKDG